MSNSKPYCEESQRGYRVRDRCIAAKNPCVTGISCDAQGDCIEGPADAVNLPVFLEIDVQNKVAQSVRVGGEQRTSEILSTHEEDRALVLLGVDQGAGWSTTIGEDDGRLTLSVSGAVIGGIAGDAGKGAAAGAAGSMLMGGIGRNR
jgi:hypothetical protein